MRQSITRHSAFFAAAGFAAALFFGGVAYGVTDTMFRYSTPQTRQATYPSASFLPETSNPPAFSNSGVSLSNAGNIGCYIAPVNNLPQGAKITSLAMFYTKNDTFNDGLFLYRKNVNDSSTLDQIASIFPANSTGAYRKAHVDITDAALQVVDNGRYFYYFEQCVSSTEVFFGARITYTVVNAGQ